MSDNQSLREHLLYLLRGGGAHLNFEDLISDFPPALFNEKVEGVPYTPWQLLEHMRIAQWDIVRFTVDADHVSPEFPRGYWPAPAALADNQIWSETVQSFRADLKEMENLLEDQSTDLFAEIRHGTGQTILREALLVADHNAYHLGSLALLKRILNKQAQ
jgi:DinB superfamily